MISKFVSNPLNRHKATIGQLARDDSTCADIPAGTRFQRDFSTYLVQHGGREVKGEAIRYAHMATIGALPNGSLVAGSILHKMRILHVYEKAARLFHKSQVLGRSWFDIQRILVDCDDSSRLIFACVCMCPYRQTTDSDIQISHIHIVCRNIIEYLKSFRSSMF